MNDFTALLTKFGTVILALASENIYLGAIFIAFISATTRTSYEGECLTHFECFARVTRYFIMATGIAMFIVHLGLWQTWDSNLTIIVTSYFTFLSEETIRFLLSSSRQLIPSILRRFYGVETRK